MPPLSRLHAPKLLRTVKDRPHATNKDHEEEARIKAVAANMKPGIAIDAEPLSSSSDDAASPAPRSGRTSPPTPEMSNTTKSKSTRALITAPPASRRRKPVKEIKAPQRGAYQSGKKGQSRRQDGEEEKENSVSSVQSSGSKRPIHGPGHDEMFGMFAEPKRKIQKTFTSNIHAKHVAPKKTETKVKTFTKTSKAGGYYSKKSMDMSKLIQESEKMNREDDDELSDISMASNPKSKKPKVKSKTTTKDGKLGLSPPKPNRLNLLEQLGGPVPDSVTPTSSANSVRRKPLNIDTIGSGASTPLSSIHSPAEVHEESNEVLREIEDYLHDIPAETFDEKCALCDESVTRDFYWDFYKGKERNTANNQLFCREHKRNTILEEYKRMGFPEVQWSGLPERIHKFYPRLMAVLTNQYNTDESPSEYRNKYSDRVEAGNNRSVRARLDEESEPDLHTGYYGQRGWDVMMATITSLLLSEMRAHAKSDPIFRSSTTHIFTEQVLVPELTICLVMEDLDCSEKVAKKCIEDSADLGMILHEAINDDIVIIDEEEDNEDE